MNDTSKTNKPFVDYRQALRLVCESELNGVARKGSALHRSLQWGYSKSQVRVSEGDLSFVWDMDGVKTLIGIKPLKNGGVRFHTQEVVVESTITPVEKG